MATFGSATVVLSGPRGSTTVEMTGARISLGRDPSSSQVINDTAVSNVHCELVKENDALLVRDLGSANGTYVNGRRVQSARLFDGDVLHIGLMHGPISVRQPNGRPLEAPAEGGTFPIVLLILALVLAAAGGVLFWKIKERATERASFQEFAAAAQEMLQQSSPCEVARTTITIIAGGEPLTVPAITKPGPLGPPELAAHTVLLQKADKRQQAMKDLIAQLEKSGAAPERQKLLEYKPNYADAGLNAAVQDVQKALLQEVEDGVKFKSDLADYAKGFDRFNDRLRKITASAERMDADIGTPPDPRKAVEVLRACEETFDKTTGSAFSKLASVPL